MQTAKFLITVVISVAISYLIMKSQSYVKFVHAPREENIDYGYLEIGGKSYRQLYTTTQVNIGNGLHYHKIDLRSLK